MVLLYVIFAIACGFLSGQFANRLDVSLRREVFFFQRGDFNKYFFDIYYLLGNVFLSIALFVVLYKEFILLEIILLFLMVVIAHFIAMIDIKTCLIPDRLQIILFILCATYAFCLKDFFWMRVVISSVIFLFLYIIYFISEHYGKKEWIGFADIKLFGSTTLCIDWSMLPMFFFAAGACGIIIYFLCGRKKVFPFAPAILFATMIFMIFYDNLLIY